MTIVEIAQLAADKLHADVNRLNATGDLRREERRRRLFSAEKWEAAPDTPLAQLIDHTMLRADATVGVIEQLCSEAREIGCRAVCVNPAYVALAANALAGSSVRVAATVGFPLGATRSHVKVVEAMDCVAQGATEIDLVINVGVLKDRQLALVLAELSDMTRAVGSAALTKVILEVCYLNTEEIALGCLLAKWAGADFVKTSTGFGSGGATTSAVSLMRAVVGSNMGVKAAGGVRGAQQARALIAAGASRIGASRTLALVAEDNSEKQEGTDA